MSLPTGQRHYDPDGPSLAWRVKLAAAKAPIAVAVTISLLVATLALLLVLRGQSQLHDTQGKLADTQAQLVREKVSATQLHAAQEGSCVRLQIERNRVNRLAAIVYLTLSESGKREERLAKGAQNTATHRRSAVVLEALARESKWTPDTDCKLAVGDAKHYRNPTPQDFNIAKATQLIPRAAKVLLEQGQ